MTFTDIVNRISFLTGTDVNSLPVTNLNLAVNEALKRVVSLINRSDSRWQFDDSNYTDLPVAKGALVANQQDYALATTHLSIDRVEIKDSGGQWHRLSPIDQQDLKRNTNLGAQNTSGIIGATNQGQALAVGETTRTGAYQASSGLPKEYDVLGTSVLLYPAPSYSQAGSILIYFTRTPLSFVYTSYSAGAFSDSTGTIASSPGFNGLFHDLIPLWASYDYGLAYGKQNTAALFAEIQRKEMELRDFYGGRNRDDKPRIGVSNDSNR